MMDNVPQISILIPIFNEEDNLRELHNRLKDVLENILQVSYEIIFIDDGSDDRSWNMIENLNRQNSNVKAIRFPRNFGQHIAITAGLDCCKGDAVILMDGDLQDPPEEIPVLYQKFGQGYDIVYAIRKVRGDTIFKKFTSMLYNRLFRLMVNAERPSGVGIFRIMRKQVVDYIRSCKEKTRYITGLIDWSGFSRIGIETRRDTRRAGKTKYTLFRSIALAMDGLTSFSYFPLRVAIYIGTFITIISFGVGIYMLIKKIFFGISTPGYAYIIVSILFIGGIQLFVVGVLGEYIGRIYKELQGRPLYIVKGKVGFDKGEQ